MELKHNKLFIGVTGGTASGKTSITTPVDDKPQSSGVVKPVATSARP